MKIAFSPFKFLYALTLSTFAYKICRKYILKYLQPFFRSSLDFLTLGFLKNKLLLSPDLSPIYEIELM